MKRIHLLSVLAKPAYGRETRPPPTEHLYLISGGNSRSNSCRQPGDRFLVQFYLNFNDYKLTCKL
jgi:hypothetical protein